MGTEADYLIDQKFDREHGEYGEEKPQQDLNPNVGNVVVSPQNGTYFEPKQPSRTDEPIYKPCPDCARLTAEIFGYDIALMQEREKNKRLESDCARLKALLADDKFAKKIAKECNDRDHDDRWCPTCEGRDNGIADYRDAIKTRIKEEGVG